MADREEARKRIMEWMSPLAKNHHHWYGWPGTWSFAEAALNAMDALAQSQPPAQAAEAPALLRGSTGICTRSSCECEREGLGLECVWLRPMGEPHVDGYPLYSGIPPAAQAPEPWRDAIDDALVCAGLDCLGPDDKPGDAIKRLVAWQIQIALDPQVSSEAQALIDRGAARVRDEGGQDNAPATS